VGRTGGSRARTQAGAGAGGEEGPPLVKEKVQALVTLHGEEATELQFAGAGTICAVRGFKVLCKL